jgi:hypothetical protein
LFIKYGTPKDGYPAIYEILLGHRRQQIGSVLEIGIGTMIPDARSSMVDWALDGYKPGGSLRAWRDWFPNAIVTGLDVQVDTQFNDEPFIVTLLCDSRSKTEVVARLGDTQHFFDLIIDDGDHDAVAQLQTCENLWPYLMPGGLYVIEDADELPSTGVPSGAAMHMLSGITDSAPRFVVTRQSPNNLMNNLVVIMKGMA